MDAQGSSEGGWAGESAWRNRVADLTTEMGGAGVLGVVVVSAVSLFVVSHWGGDAAGDLLPAIALVSLAMTIAVAWWVQARAKRLIGLVALREEGFETTQRQVTLALDTMSQGVCFFGGDGRLVTSNGCYARMYGIDPGRIVPGMTLRAVMELRAAAGSCPAAMDIEGYLNRNTREVATGAVSEEVIPLANGQFMLVKSCPLPDGGWISTHLDVTEEKRSQDRLAFMARHDALTGSFNRFAFRHALEAAVAETDRAGRGVLLLDLERFKAVNDGLGHAAGDALLRQIATRLGTRLGTAAGEGAMLARLGGDEFAILGGRGEASPERLGRAVADAMEAPFAVGDRSVRIGLSIGATAIGADDADADAVLSRADLALFAAKKRGGGCEVFTAELALAHRRRRALEEELARAVEGGEFELYYQSQHAVGDERTVGFEALIRWRHPVRGLLGPGEFIPLAEETGLIVPIGRWVIGQACRDARSWPGALMVAVNVSALQFRDGGLVAHVAAVLEETGLPAGRLELEITETALMERTAEALAALSEIRRMGVAIALDDFGTGYSSLSYLRKLPFDSIKIDRSFMEDLDGSEEARSIASTIVRLAHELGGRTIAEGVETRAQAEVLGALGCDLAQGFLFSRPMPGAAVADFLGARRQWLSRGRPLVSEMR